MPEFYGQVSIVARITFCISANSEEEAKEKLFNANMPMDLVDDNNNPVCEIDSMEWHMVDEAVQGNVQESDLSDFEIEEEVETVSNVPENEDDMPKNVNEEGLNYQEDWDSSRPLPNHPHCKECVHGQAYLIDPADGETQTLRCIEPECWELKMQEPVYTMSNTFLHTAKCPVNCEHVVTVMNEGQSFKMCKNGECEFNKPEPEPEKEKPSEELLEQRKSRMPKDLNAHFYCPKNCKYRIQVVDHYKLNGIDFRCTNPEFIDNFYTQDWEFNQESHEAWKACRGVFETDEAKSDVLPVKTEPEYTLQNTMNIQLTCPYRCIYRVRVMHLGELHQRCSNPELFCDGCEEDPESKWSKCRGVLKTTVGENKGPEYDWDKTLPITDMCNTACIHRVRMTHDEHPGVSERCKNLDCPHHSSGEKPGSAAETKPTPIQATAKTCHHVDNDGRTLFVTYGAAGRAYRTFYHKTGEDTLTCMKSTSMPYVDSREEAERNLVEYAEKRGWKKVGQEEPEQPEKPAEQPETRIGKLLSLPLESDEYKFLLRAASDKELDLTLFREHRENARFRLQAEKDRRLLANVNSQLGAKNIGQNDHNQENTI